MKIASFVRAELEHVGSSSVVSLLWQSRGKQPLKLQGSSGGSIARVSAPDGPSSIGRVIVRLRAPEVTNLLLMMIRNSDGA